MATHITPYPPVIRSFSPSTHQVQALMPLSPGQPASKEKNKCHRTPWEQGVDTENVNTHIFFFWNFFLLLASILFQLGDANPSPNSYSLPSMIGPRVPNRTSSAYYSMAKRISLGGFDTDYAKTPGPARYATTDPDNYQKKAPTYSMLSRNFMPGGKIISNYGLM